MEKETHNHPQHAHLMQRTNPLTVYPQYSGQWKCDNCENSYDNRHTPHHCVICSYDICEACFQPRPLHPRHEHQLYFLKMANIYSNSGGEWKCDACQQVKGPPLAPNAYHCFQDEFDLCTDCFKGRKFPIHRHPLVPAVAARVYSHSSGLWICDCCKRTGTEIGTHFSWHCPECEFDCCNRCLEDVQISSHAHPLKITDSRLAYPACNGGWRCNLCENTFNPSTPEYNTDKPYHCFICQFDVCHNCYGRDETGPPHRHPPTGGRAGLNQPCVPHQPPTKFFFTLEMLVDDDDTSVENLDDSQKCIVCLDKPKNATIVHGNTGHVCCCLTCASTLQRRGDKCPICRAAIDRVIKHYNS